MKSTLRIFLLISSIALLSACSAIQQLVSPATQTPTLTLTATVTNTPLPTLTPTPPPSAAIVNGIYVWMEDLELKKANLSAAYAETAGSQPADSDLTQEALEMLINETLFQSAAIQNGIEISEEELDQRIQAAAESAGGQDAFQQWMAENHFTNASFRRSLTREVSAAKVRAVIYAEKLANVDQIHAYQIVTATRAEASTIKTKLDLGVSFVEMAKTTDKITGGNLDWVARGILVYPELEDALFSLQPGSYTDIIETDIGFHILFAANRSTDHELSLQSRQLLEHRALAEWLEEQKANAEISILLP